eukprot:1883181-Pyramimonas_sp.AAC.1
MIAVTVVVEVVVIIRRVPQAPPPLFLTRGRWASRPLQGATALSPHDRLPTASGARWRPPGALETMPVAGQSAS